MEASAVKICPPISAQIIVRGLQLCRNREAHNAGHLGSGIGVHSSETWIALRRNQDIWHCAKGDTTLVTNYPRNLLSSPSKMQNRRNLHILNQLIPVRKLPINYLQPATLVTEI